MLLATSFEARRRREKAQADGLPAPGRAAARRHFPYPFSFACMSADRPARGIFPKKRETALLLPCARKDRADTPSPKFFSQPDRSAIPSIYAAGILAKPNPQAKIVRAQCPYSYV